MKCCNCFHWSICSETRPDSDATMCKQYIHNTAVLRGPARKVIEEELERLQERNRKLTMELESCKRDNEELEQELWPLRIIKQTLEMSSGMKFDY